MNTVQKRRGTGKSRRDFAKIMGLGMAGSALARASTVSARAQDADAGALAKFATEGTPARLTATELADLTKDIQEGQKNLTKVRDFKVPAEVEPAFVFRAR